MKKCPLLILLLVFVGCGKQGVPFIIDNEVGHIDNKTYKKSFNKFYKRSEKLINKEIRSSKHSLKLKEVTVGFAADLRAGLGAVNVSPKSSVEFHIEVNND